MDNKKLTKYLFISGFALLLIIILVRLVVKNSGDRVTDMPAIGELDYRPGKMETKSKIEQFKEEDNAHKSQAMGLKSEDNYIVPNFNELIKKQEPPIQSIPVPSIDNQKPISTEKNPVNSPVQSQPYKNPALDNHSDYFDNNKENESKDKVEPPVERNPFGTIYGNQKSPTTKTVMYYTGEIYGDQRIAPGGNIVIRNTETINYLSLVIPRNSILYGQASFTGNNRVYVRINRAKTSAGEFPVSLSLQDNDRIEGLYYKAPIDESVDDTKEEVNLPKVGGKYSGVINKVTETVVREGKDLMRKSQTLNLEEGYKVYIVPYKNN